LDKGGGSWRRGGELGEVEAAGWPLELGLRMEWDVRRRALGLVGIFATCASVSLSRDDATESSRLLLRPHSRSSLLPPSMDFDLFLCLPDDLLRSGDGYLLVGPGGSSHSGSVGCLK
jgi:hypothetical protein